MKNLIIKTALITVGGLIALCLILWGLFSWLAPSVMVSIADGLGMDKSAAAYSVSVYEKSGKIDDLADAVERNFSCGKYEVCAKYGENLLKHESFSDYSSQKQGYKQEVAGMTAVSLYKKGDKTNALNVAADNTVGKFEKFNGLERLLDCAMNAEDEVFVSEIRVKISGIVLEPTDTEGETHRRDVIAVCDAFLNN